MPKPKSEYQELQNVAVFILQSALRGPYLPEDHPPNLASWVGANTLPWNVVMFFKRSTENALWFCHVDIEWQRTFLMIVAIELLHTIDPGEVV